MIGVPSQRDLALSLRSPQKDPWRDGGWLAEFIGATAEEDRAEWATTFAAAAEASLVRDAAHRLWERWVSELLAEQNSRYACSSDG